MNLLYLAHRVPYPPDKGDKLRAFRQLERLALSHRVWCGCFVDRPADRKWVSVLEDLCEGVTAIEVRPTAGKIRGLGALLGGGTATERFYRHDEMDAALRALASRVDLDVVVAFSSGMAQHALGVPARRRVLDLCDLDSLKWLEYAAASRRPAAWVYRTEGRRLARREVEWISRFDATLLITEAEARGLPLDADRQKVHIIGNGVHLPPLTRDRSDERAPVVGFVGTMDYRPNVDAVGWFCRACWPSVRERWPGATFRIVGRNPTRSMRRLAAVKGVTIVGEVESVLDELAAMDVSVAPMRIARGLQNKVLEAMSAALPVVLTPQAAEGIGGEAGRAYFVEADAAAFADRVAKLCGNAVVRHKVGTAARRFVDVRHRWDTQLDKLEFVVTGISKVKRLSHQPSAISRRSAAV